MKGFVWSRLVLACLPCSELGENRHLKVGRLACLLEFIYKLLLLNLKWISESFSLESHILTNLEDTSLHMVFSLRLECNYHLVPMLVTGFLERI